MKKLLVLSATIAMIAMPAKAQLTGTNSFLGQVGIWLTSQNPTNAWGTNDSGAIFAGADNQNGVGMSASLEVEYHIYKALTLDAITRNSSIAGTAVSEQGDLGVSFNLVDVQLGFGGGGGYSIVNKGIFGDVFMEAKKKMTTRTLVGLRVENDFYVKGNTKNVPLVTVFTGFTF